MAQETTDKPSKKGRLMTEKELAEYNKTWKDMEELSLVLNNTKEKKKRK